jgi:hypothetical protein
VFKTWKQNSILRPCSNFFWLSIRKACQNGTILIAPLILISFLLASLSLSLSLFFPFFSQLHPLSIWLYCINI